jgi:hypothetical protein
VHVYFREIEIIQRLEQKIVQFENDILSTCDACAELDWYVRFNLIFRWLNALKNIVFFPLPRRHACTVIAGHVW